MKTTLRKMGNSTGVIIPKAFLTELGFASGDVEMTLEDGAIVIRQPTKDARVGWAQASIELSAEQGDVLQWPSIANRASEDVAW